MSIFYKQRPIIYWLITNPVKFLDYHYTRYRFNKWKKTCKDGLDGIVFCSLDHFMVNKGTGVSKSKGGISIPYPEPRKNNKEWRDKLASVLSRDTFGY